VSKGVACASLLLLVAGTVHADERQLAREHFERGSRAFVLGAYDEAIAEYSAAYRVIDDPVLLYNIAQAHRQAQHFGEALRFYKLYLSLKPDAQNRNQVEGKIAELQRVVDQQKAAQEAPKESQPPSVAKPSESRSAIVQPIVQRPLGTEAKSEGRPGRAKKIAGVIVAALGLATLATGVTLGALAKSYEGEVVMTFDLGKASDGTNFGTAGPILMVVGGAALVVGVVVAVLGVRESRKKSHNVAATDAVGALRISF